MLDMMHIIVKLRLLKKAGENSINIMSSNEYLTRVNLMDAASEDADTPVTQYHAQSSAANGYFQQRRTGAFHQTGGYNACCHHC